MSSGYSIFIRYSGSIEEINEVLFDICYKKADIEDVDERSGKRYWYQVMGTEFTLASALDFEDDLDLDLTNYNYVIITKMYSRYWQNPEYLVLCESMAKFLGYETAKTLKTKTLVVYELQDEISRYDYSHEETNLA